MAFKPDTDDIREAPALYIIRELLSLGVEISAYDPEAMPNVSEIMGDSITYGESRDAILDEADALVIATEWQVFRTPDFKKMAALMNQKVIFDGRNLYDAKEMKELGFHYKSIGRK